METFFPEEILSSIKETFLRKLYDDLLAFRAQEEEIFSISKSVDRSSKASWAAYAEVVLQKSRKVLYGDLYHEGSPSKEDSTQPGNLQRSKEREEFFANLGSVEELKDFIINMKQVLLHFVGSRSTSAEFLNFSVSEEFRSSLLNAIESRNWEEVESMVMPIAAALPRRAAIYEAFTFLASLLISVVFQYLIGLVDKGGTKTHSGSLEFRSRYISIVLFQGAYVWIKFREVAPPSPQKPSPGLHRKCRVNDLGVREYYGNFEPRFKPSGSANYVSVGSYEEEEDARIIHQILAFYYGRAVPGELPLLNGSTYLIPRMTEEEQHLDREAKKEWAKGKAMAVFDEFKGALMESLVLDCLFDPQEGQVTGDISNTLPPDAGAGCGSQPVQLENQNDGLVPPNAAPGMHDHVTGDPCSDHAGGGAGVGDEAPLEPQFQRHDLEEYQVNNVNPDDLGILRLVKELQRQQQLDQFRIQQLESRLRQQESQIQQQGSQIQQQGSQIQQQETRISGLEQLQELQMQQQVARISELEGEVERLRSTDTARKRICVGVSLRHDSQN